MIQADTFIGHLLDAGFGLLSGVPCSYLTPLINMAIDDPRIRYVGAANEGDAVAIACGAELGGVHSAVMFQNSGFGNAVNPLTSLTSTLKIPVLVIATWRGQPDGAPDEPQHATMGRITPALFDLMGIPWEMFPEREVDIPSVVQRAAAHMRTARTPYGLIMKKGTVATRTLETQPDFDRHFQLKALVPERAISRRHEPDHVLCAVKDAVHDDDVVLATTGYTGRALFALGDRPNQLYMVGSMGCISSLGLGLAIAQPNRRVVVLDGDGSALMRLGALAIIGHEQPPNLTHILLDNAVHDSTGRQATVAPTVDFASIASACGYPYVLRSDTLSELTDVIRDVREQLTFVHVKTLPRANRKLPRPTVTPDQVASRLRRQLGIGAWS